MLEVVKRRCCWYEVMGGIVTWRGIFFFCFGCGNLGVLRLVGMVERTWDAYQGRHLSGYTEHFAGVVALAGIYGPCTRSLRWLCNKTKKEKREVVLLLSCAVDCSNDD